MTIQQAIQEIKSINKHYLQIEKPMTQAYFSDMCKRAESGHLKHETLRAFLERFGYSLNVELTASKMFSEKQSLTVKGEDLVNVLTRINNKR